MNFSNQMRYFLEAWKNSVQSLKQAQILVLFFGYAILQIIILLSLIFFAYAPLSGLYVPMIQKLFGEPALHYPNNYLVLPTLFTWANIILSGLIGILIVGAGTDLFAAKFTQKQVTIGMGFRDTLPKYLFLFIAWFIETLIVTLILIGTPILLAKLMPEVQGIVTQSITTFLALFFSAMFAYTTALIILEKKGAIAAVAKSLSLFGKFPVISFLLIALPNIIKMPLELLSGKTQFLIAKFNPEIIGIILGLSIIISIFANYFLVGTVTRFFISLKDKKIFLT